MPLEGLDRLSTHPVLWSPGVAWGAPPRSGVCLGHSFTAWRTEDGLNPFHQRTGPGNPSTPHTCPQRAPSSPPHLSPALRVAQALRASSDPVLGLLRLACCAVGGESRSPGLCDHTPRRRGDQGSGIHTIKPLQSPSSPVSVSWRCAEVAVGSGAPLGLHVWKNCWAEAGSGQAGLGTFP